VRDRFSSLRQRLVKLLRQYCCIDEKDQYVLVELFVYIVFTKALRIHQTIR